MKKILVLGATSAIAQEVDKCFAKDGATFYLVGRNPEKLKIVTDDLMVRGAKVWPRQADLNNTTLHAEILDDAIAVLGHIDLLFIASGSLPNQDEVEKNPDRFILEWNTNFLSIALFLNRAMPYFEKQAKGRIAVISSVSADRPRRDSHLYSTAKAALEHYVEGLRIRSTAKDLSFLTIKPGFVDTPMTAHLKKSFLFANPASVGRAIYKAILTKKKVIYVPGYWRLLMLIFKSMPRFLYRKIKPR